MNRRRRVRIQAVLLGTWLSGALWLPLHFFLQRHGRFGTSPHPMEPWMLRLHGAFAFAMLWSGGFLWATHIVSGWRGGRRRRSGIALAAMAALLIVTGYLLYYAGSDEFRSVVSMIHWGIGLAAPAFFLSHRLLRRKVSAHAPNVALRLSGPVRAEPVARSSHLSSTR